MGIEHFHNKLFGYCDDTYFSIVRDAVKRFPSGSHFVEVGALLGKSSSYIAVEIANSGKNINYEYLKIKTFNLQSIINEHKLNIKI